MATTTIRVDVETHARLRKLSEEGDASLTETVREAAEALRRQRFGRRSAEQFEALQRDRPEAWADYQADAEATLVTDGVD